MASKPIIQGPRVSIPVNRGGGSLYESEAPTTPVLDKLYHIEYLFGAPLSRPLQETVYFHNVNQDDNFLTTLEFLAAICTPITFVNSNRGTNIQSYIEYIVNTFTIDIANRTDGNNIQSYVEYISKDCSYITLINKLNDNNVQSYIEFPSFTTIIPELTNLSNDNNVQSNPDSHLNPFHMGQEVNIINT